MYFALKTEHKMLKNFGIIVGYLIIVLSIITMIAGAVFVAKMPDFMNSHCKMHEKNEQIMEKGAPTMQEEKTEKENEKNIANKQQIKKEAKGCPVKTKAQIEKELKEGKITGAACHADTVEKNTKKK